MDYPDDPWNTPDPNKAQPRPVAPRANGTDDASPALNGAGLFATSPSDGLPKRTTSTFTTTAASSRAGDADSRHNTASTAQSPGGGWEYFGGSPSTGTGGVGVGAGAGSSGGFNDAVNPSGQAAAPFGIPEDGGNPGGEQPARLPSRTLGSGRTGSSIEENILVVLMPEKEGMFMFQHHNYEVTSSRRGSKVIRRYSDFVWLLDCLHKRFPFRVLPLLPPKRVAGKAPPNGYYEDEPMLNDA